LLLFHAVSPYSNQKLHIEMSDISKKNLLFAVTSVTSKEWCRPQATRAKRSRATLRSRPGSSHPSKVAVMPASERPSLPYLKVSRQSQQNAYVVQQMIEGFLLGTYGMVLKV